MCTCHLGLSCSAKMRVSHYMKTFSMLGLLELVDPELVGLELAEVEDLG